MAAPNAYAPVANADPSWVGSTFVSKFYDMLAKHPEYLHGFYKDFSTLTITDMQNDGDTPRSATDLKSIQELVTGTIGGARATVKNVDAQFSVQGGVLLNVVGVLLIQGQERSFNQTFFLATQENGFYVHNDLLRVYPAAAVPLSNGDHKEPPTAVPRAAPAQAPSASSAVAGLPKPAPPATQKQQRSQAASPALPNPAATLPAVSTQPATIPPRPPSTQPEVTQSTPSAQPSPSPASTSWAALVKHPQAQTATPIKTPPSTPAHTPAPAHVDSQPVNQPQANGNVLSHAPDRSHGADSATAAGGGGAYSTGPVHHHTVIVRNLPNEHLAVELFEEEFSKFGPLRKGPGAVTIHNMGRDQGKVAYVKFDDAGGVEAVLQAIGVTILDRVVDVGKHEGPLPSYQTRGGPGGRGSFRGGRPGGMGPPGRGNSYGGDGGRGPGRGGMGGDRSARPDRRPPSGNFGGGSGSGVAPAGGQGAATSGNNTRSGSAHGSRGRGGPRKDDASGPAPSQDTKA